MFVVIKKITEIFRFAKLLLKIDIRLNKISLKILIWQLLIMNL